MDRSGKISSDLFSEDGEVGVGRSNDPGTITHEEQGVEAIIGTMFQWLPHIDFADLSSLFKSKMNSSEVSKDLFRYALLSAIRINRQVAQVQPASQTLERFTGWIREWAKPDLSQIAQFYGPLESQDIGDLTDLDEHEVTDLMNRLSYCACLESFSPLLALLNLVVENCKEIVSGSSNAIEILQKHHALQEFHAWCTSRSDYRSFFQALGHTYPRLRILEIGGGYGGTTAAVIGGLISGEKLMYSSYVYTSSSPDVVTSAAKIHKFPRMQHRVLDISRDPSEQGLEGEPFDLVIAGETLRKTKDAKRALTHIRMLLRPGGYLCLQASQGGQPVFNIIFGTLYGWWPEEKITTRSATTADVSAGGADQWQQQWNDDLLNTGFTGIDVKVSYNTTPGNLKLNIVSRAATPKPKLVGLMLFYNPLKQSQHLSAMKTALARGGIEFLVSAISQISASKKQHIPLKQKVVCMLGLEYRLLGDVLAADMESFKKTLQSLETEHIFWIIESMESLDKMRSLCNELSLSATIIVMQSTNSNDWELAVRVLESYEDFEDASRKEGDLAISDGVLKVGRKFFSCNF